MPGGGLVSQPHRGVDLREGVPVLADIWPGDTEKATARVDFNETGVWYQQTSNMYQMFRPPDSSVNHRIQLCSCDKCALDAQWVTVAEESDDFQFANFNGRVVHYLTGLDLHKDWWVRIGYDAKVYNHHSDCTTYVLGGGPIRSGNNKGWTPPCGPESDQGAGWTYSKPARVLRSPIAHPVNEVIHDANVTAGSDTDVVGFQDGAGYGTLYCNNGKDRWGRNDQYCHDNFEVGTGAVNSHTINIMRDTTGQSPDKSHLRIMHLYSGENRPRRLPLGVENAARLNINGKTFEFEDAYVDARDRYEWSQTFGFANNVNYPFSIYIPVSEITTPADRLLDVTISAGSVVGAPNERGY